MKEWLVFLVIVCVWHVCYASKFYVCDAADENILGVYIKTEDITQDGVAVYTNAADMSIFRNKGFWYIGNLGPWPPETHYRCVEPENCNYSLDYPPVPGKFSVSKRFGTAPAPTISDTPCQVTQEL